MPTKKTKPATKLPKVIDGLTRLAAAIADHFKIPCTKQSIKNWQKRVPPFPNPAESGSNRYNRAECFAWVQNNILSGANAPQEISTAELLQRAVRAEAEEQIQKTEKITLEVAAKKGQFIERGLAESTIKAAIIKLHSIVRAELEHNSTTDRRQKLLMLGIDETKADAFYEFDLQYSKMQIDRIEEICAKLAGTA